MSSSKITSFALASVCSRLPSKYRMITAESISEILPVRWGRIVIDVEPIFSGSRNIVGLNLLRAFCLPDGLAGGRRLRFPSCHKSRNTSSRKQDRSGQDGREKCKPYPRRQLNGSGRARQESETTNRHKFLR